MERGDLVSPLFYVILLLKIIGGHKYGMFYIYIYVGFA